MTVRYGYQPMHPPERQVSQKRMQEILRKRAPQSKTWPTASGPEKALSQSPRAQGPLQWQRPEPGSMGVRTTDEWYSCCKIGQPDGSMKYEVWTRNPLTGGMTQLAVGLSTEAAAKAAAEQDASTIPIQGK